MIASNNSTVTFNFFHSAAARGFACWCDAGYACQNRSNSGHGADFTLFGLVAGASGVAGVTGNFSASTPQ